MRQGEKYKLESAWKFKGINCLPAVRVVIKFSLLTSALLRLCEINLQTHWKLPLLFILVLKPANPKQCAEKHWHASGSHPTKNVNLEKCHETFFPSLLLCNIFSLVYSSDQDRTMSISLEEQKLDRQSFAEVTKVQLQFFSHSLAQAGLDVKDYLEISAFKEQILPGC